MAEPARKFNDIEPDIKPNFGVINGGGNTTPDRATLRSIEKQESNPEQINNDDDISKKESEGSNVIQGPWKNNVNNVKIGSKKKKGPLTAIIIALIGGISGIGLISAPALLPQSILANLVKKFNSQETSYTIRADKLMASKMTESTTSGSCKIITALCRFTTPSNRFLTQLEKNGVKAFDGDGNLIEKKTLFPNTRPKTYKFINSSGDEISVNSKNFYNTLAENSEFRAAFHNASQTRLVSLSDNVFKSIKSKFKFSSTDKLSKTTDDASLTDEINNEVSVDDASVKSAIAEGDDAVEDAVNKIITEEADQSVEKLSKSGRGNAVGLIAGGVCLITDVPGLIINANRSFQMMQIVKYASVFLSTFGAIKAGDATPAEVSAMGKVLTKVVSGKSAMDSFGMKYTITGQTKPTSNSYQKFTPGYSAMSLLGGINLVTSSEYKENACAVATNPVTGLALDAISTGTIILPILNVLVGLAGSAIVGKVLPPILEQVIKLIPTEKILKMFMGDFTQNLSGEDVGDALTSGASHLMGQTANAGGNMPLTVDQAVAYGNTTKQVQLAYAEEDRATKSPFDISSPNTMLGSFIQNLIPYYTSSSSTIGSIASTFSTISKIVVGSFGTVLEPITAGAESDDSSQYQLCSDPSIKNNDIAAGPFCNITYGVPTQYLYKDSVDVLNSLIASGDVDPQTGDPTDKKADSSTVASLKSWITLCTDGKTDEAKNCQIKDQTTADYALYTIDHRIQQSMDGDNNGNSTY